MKLISKITADNLLIRPFTEADLGLFLEFMLDEKATRYLMFTDEQKTEKGAAELFQYVIDSYQSDQPVHSYAIALKDNSFIGSCGFSKLFDSPLTYECYYSILPRHWKKGYASQATRMLIDYCFAHFNIQEMRAYMDPDNLASQAVARKLGMNCLGIEKHPQFGTNGKLYSVKRIN